MGGSGQKYGRYRDHLTREKIKRKHQSVDSDAYIFDVEYEKLKKEQERLEAEYEREREKYLRISEELREEMLNGTASDTDMARFMAALTDRGVQLQQEQAKMQESIDKLNDSRTDIENQMNELRKNAFSGATNAYNTASKTTEYNGFNAESKYSNAKIVEMTPQEYIRRAAFGENGTGSLQALMQSASPATVEKYMRAMLRGTKYNAPSVGGARGTTTANTARVIAAMMNGYSRIPVMVVE